MPDSQEAWDVWSHCLEAGDATLDMRASDLRAMIDAFCARSRRAFFVAKTPRFTNHIAVLRCAYPSARFVHIIRDGRAATLSIQAKMRRSDPDAPLDRACERWIKGVSKVRGAALSIDLLEIRYEDLCGDVHGVLEIVFDHAALPPSRSLLDRLPSRLTATNRARIERASPEELEYITHLEGQLLSAYGYL